MMSDNVILWSELIVQYLADNGRTPVLHTPGWMPDSQRISDYKTGIRIHVEPSTIYVYVIDQGRPSSEFILRLQIGDLRDPKIDPKDILNKILKHIRSRE